MRVSFAMIPHTVEVRTSKVTFLAARREVMFSSEGLKWTFEDSSPLREKGSAAWKAEITDGVVPGTFITFWTSAR